MKCQEPMPPTDFPKNQASARVLQAQSPYQPGLMIMLEGHTSRAFRWTLIGGLNARRKSPAKLWGLIRAHNQQHINRNQTIKRSCQEHKN